MKKSVQVMLTPEAHLRLKVNAARLALSMGELITFMLGQQFPFRSVDEHLDFVTGVKAQEQEEAGQ